MSLTDLVLVILKKVCSSWINSYYGMMLSELAESKWVNTAMYEVGL